MSTESNLAAIEHGLIACRETASRIGDDVLASDRSGDHGSQSKEAGKVPRISQARLERLSAQGGLVALTSELAPLPV